MHEAPEVPFAGRPNTGPVLRDGLVITIEPILVEGSPQVAYDPDGWTVRTLDGGWAAQFEHTIIVTPARRPDSQRGVTGTEFTTENTEHTERERIFTAEHAETAEIEEEKILQRFSLRSLSVSSVFSVVIIVSLGGLRVLCG